MSAGSSPHIGELPPRNLLPQESSRLGRGEMDGQAREGEGRAAFESMQEKRKEFVERGAEFYAKA